MAQIKCIKGDHTHGSQDEYRRCLNGELAREEEREARFRLREAAMKLVPQTESGRPLPAEPPASEKQLAFLASLATQKLEASEASRVIADANGGRWGRRSISTEIDRLKALPRPVIENTPGKADESHEERRTAAGLTDGMYQVGETIYKVQVAVHGSGQLYAKELQTTDECLICYRTEEEHKVEFSIGDHDFKPKWKFAYAPGAILKLRPEHKMSMEQAQKFGQLYGVCCVCGLPLTREESIEKGIGPICEAKFS